MSRIRIAVPLILTAIVVLSGCSSGAGPAGDASLPADTAETSVAADPTATTDPVAATEPVTADDPRVFDDDLCPLLGADRLAEIFGETATTEHLIGISCQYTTASGGSASLSVQEGTEGTFNEVSYGSRSLLTDQTPRPLSGFTGQAVVFASTVSGTQSPIAVAIVEFPSYVVSTDVSVAGDVEAQARIAEALLRAGLDAGLG